VQDLLNTNDSDWAAFSRGDPEYLLRTAGRTIRQYCGWHLFPSLQMTLNNLVIGSNGAIMLPSLHVTDVESVVLQTGIDADDTVTMDPDQYTWFDYGKVQPAGLFWWSGSYTAYYYGPDSPAYVPWMNYGWATVTFTHGYDSLPEDIKQVAFEMARASGASGTTGGGGQLPANTNIKEVASPGFRLVLGGAGQGMGGTGTVGSLTENQKNRLASYRIGAVK
jgi:hypothetical protein